MFRIDTYYPPVSEPVRRGADRAPGDVPHGSSTQRPAVEADPVEAIIADFGRCFGGKAPGHEPPWLARDLTLGQMRLLVRLRRAGSMTMGQVADDLGVTVASATGAIERIERQGLVLRIHGTEDRRIVVCRLTPAGEQITADLAGVRANAWRRILGTLDDAELAEFARLVHLLAERSGDPTSATHADHAGTESAP
jgi:DNA-binding MarR family transcriptional regulator